MPKAKKFGTFGGVFTPSILTILGVIMYLRFPMIIGQAGLLMTLGIVIVAHLISVTTSLSVSSIATDKKVKTGGTYYMISRSLGLPIGGTLGIALFVGLSFSVSLYLIGFAESFLNYFGENWGIEVNKNTIRITGTIILIVVTTITFISTSLAIKSQYIIMVLIGLSLLSIFLGKHEFAPKEILIKPIADAAPFMILFGIFFPAVTGFEAGVSMSGDLKDPKRSLPRGAMAAVGVGFAAYIGLALFYTFTIDSDALANNPNILFEVSLIPELVIVGIFGATLSSAFGSILGAPRILQATAIDKIVPKFLAKGYGASNEPRNALLMTFLIAEAGILIGELDMIARIVSMFFITTYAFLNLACFIESWASSDFRPSFKIHKSVSLIGALASILVMILLDFVALIGAVFFLTLLFLFLKRKQLILEKGDAWGSFAATLIKKNISKLSRKKTDIRNWRPNILMFSNDSDIDAEFEKTSKIFTGKHGMLTNIVLKEIPDADYTVRQIKNEIKPADNEIFIKKFKCQNMYQAIKNITGIYGFSGIEPNTILLDYMFLAKNPEQFIDILEHIRTENLNTLILKHNTKKYINKFKTIDVWWRGKGRYLSLTLSLLRTILQDSDWRDAKIRIITINEDSAAAGEIHNQTMHIIDNYRINASVKIIDNSIHKLNVLNIISTESAETDLTIFGISENIMQKPHQVIKKFEAIANLSGSLLILDPEKDFKYFNTGIKEITVKKSDEAVPEIYKADIPDIKNELLRNQLISVFDKLSSVYTQFIIHGYNESVQLHKELINSYKQLVKNTVDEIKQSENVNSKFKKAKLIDNAYNNFLFQIKTICQNSDNDYFLQEKKILEESLSEIETQIIYFIEKIPEYFYINYNNKSKKIPIRKAINYHFNIHLRKNTLKFLSEYNINSYESITEIQKVIYETSKHFLSIAEESNNYSDNLENIKHKTENNFDKLYNNFEKISSDLLLKNLSLSLNKIAKELQNPGSFRSLKKKYKIKTSDKADILKLSELPYERHENLILLNNSNHIEFLSLDIKHRLKKHTDKTNEKIISNINSLFNDKINIQKECLSNFNKQKEETIGLKFNFSDNKLHLADIFSQQFADFLQFLETVEEEIITGITKPEGDIKPQTVDYRKIVSDKIETVFYENMFKDASILDKQFTENIFKLQDTARLFNFNFENIDTEDNKAESAKKQKELIDETLQKICSIEESAITNYNRLLEKQNKYSEETFEHLHSYAVIHISKEKTSKVTKRKKDKISKKIISFSNKVLFSLGNIPVKIIYKKSSGLLLAGSLTAEEKETNLIQKLSRIVDKVMPDTNLTDKIALSYQNLFNNSFSINEDLRIIRKHELMQAKDAITAFSNGYSGGIAIIGEALSGKTTLARQIFSEHFTSNNFIKIRPPKEGSISINDFNKEMKKAFGTNNKVDNILQNLPYNCFIFIDDIELWWERSEKGFKVLKHIEELIYKHGNRHLFVIACNTHTYNFLNKYKNIDANFNAVIECKAFDTEMIKKAILLRHYSGGLKFMINKKTEEKISRFRLATFFDSIFNYSSGNIGVAINTWKANITKFNNNIVHIKYAAIPALTAFNFIDDDKLNLLIQFVLHKNLTIKRISSIMQVHELEARIITDSLLRSRIIVRENEIFTLNKYFIPFIIRILKRKKLL